MRRRGLVRTTTWKGKAADVCVGLEINALGHDLFINFEGKRIDYNRAD